MELLPMSLEGRVAIISGATGGLGPVVARRLLDEGARLALFATSAEKLDPLARGLGADADRLMTRAVDLRDADATGAAVEAVRERFDGVQILAHLVGGYSAGTPLAEARRDELVAMLDQLVWTTFNLVRALVPHLIAGGWGRLVAVSPTTVATPGPDMAPYVTAKAGQEALLIALARELKGTGCTANVLVVRAIDVQHVRDREPSPKTAAWTTPEEIAAAIVYLCSDEARVVNGARIPLNGA
jgi:NAD(P)-dependent dehydrogenase (short-subunit alcohol dehydrogenase family)